MTDTADPDGARQAPPPEVSQPRLPLFFATPELTQCLDLLLHLIGNSDLLPLLMGEEGAGKTTLLFRLQSRIPEDWVLARVDAHPMLHPEQLLSQLAAAFGVPEEDDRLADHLLRRFEVLSHAGSVPVVAVDDAHQLPVETLAALLRLYQQSGLEGAGVRILLFAAPQIEQSLVAPEVQALQFGAFHRLRLLPFTREQTRAFVTHLLVADGRMIGAGQLSDGQIDKIHRESYGSPGRIEYLVTRLILQGGLGERPVPATTGDWRQRLRAMPRAWLAAGGGVLVLLLLVLTFQDAINALFTGEAASEHEAVGKPVAVPLALPSEGDLKSAGKPVAAESELVEAPELLRDAQGEGGAAAPIDAPPEAAAAGEAPIVLAVDAVVDAKAQAPQAAGPPAAGAEQAVPEAGPVAEKPPETVAPPPAEPPPVAAPKKAAPVEPKAEPKAGPAPPKKPATATVFAQREDWLRQQKASAYTLQLVALPSESAMRKYIERHRLQGKVAYFRTVRQGQTWFALVYGVYPDRKAALAALSSLPADLDRKSVWLRSMGSVQAAIAP